MNEWVHKTSDFDTSDYSSLPVSFTRIKQIYFSSKDQSVWDVFVLL